jgi:large subunit ribosomal protein L25
MADQLRAEKRTQFGKGAARKIRAAHKIPAVIYGHGTEPQHVTLPGHETSLIIRRANAILDLDIEGTAQLALVKDVQKDPVRQTIEHMDLIIVRRGEKVTVDVPVHVDGESAPGTIATLETTTVSVEVEATAIPENVHVSVEGLEAGAQVTAADVVLPRGASLVSDPETLIVGIAVPAAEISDEAEETEGEESEEGAATEGTADADGDADSE